MSKKLTCLGAALALIVAAGAGFGAGADDDETPTISEIMVKLHKGADAPLAVLKGALKSDTPPWPKVQDASKDFVILGASLAKNETPKGDQAGFEKLSDEFFTLSKQLDDAAKAEELEDNRSAFNKLSASCKSCHQAHRP